MSGYTGLVDGALIIRDHCKTASWLLSCRWVWGWQGVRGARYMQVNVVAAQLQVFVGGEEGGGLYILDPGCHPPLHPEPCATTP